MLNKILHLSLSNRVITLMLAAGITLLGMVMLMRTEVDIFPDLNAPTVVVMTEAPGYTPEEVERIVTYPIETAVNGSTGVRRVSSSSMPGFSAVKIEFDWGTEIQTARQTINEKIQSVSEAFPAGVGVPTMGPQSSILGEVMIVGLTASDSTVDMATLRTLADRVMRPRLLALGGVSQVAVIGGDEVEYQILLDTRRMRFHGVTLDQVRSALDGFNNNASGGVLYEYGNEYLIKGSTSTADVEDMERVVVRSENPDSTLLLSDIATVQIGAKSPQLGLASVEAKPAVLVTITKQPGVGTIELTERIESEVADMSSAFPAGVEVSTDIFKQSDFIDTSISNLQESLFEGAIFVVIVLFFFLMNLRTTLISLIALPLSIIISVLVLYLMGQTINTMSLGGIAIAIGSLVDDAIVDVENVYKRLRENRALPEGERRSVISVVYEASKEVRIPIFNSTLIIIAGFLPLFFLSGIEGRMLIPLGVSFIVALFASTVVALTVTPVLCSYLLSTKKSDKILSREPFVIRHLKSFYDRVLELSFRRYRLVLGAVAVLFVVAVALFFTLGRSFLPSFNEGSFTINISTLPGISLEESDRLGRQAEEIILSVPEIKTVARKTGRAELDEHSFGVNVSEIEAPYDLGAGRSRREIAAELRERLSELPGVMVEIGQPVSHRIDAMLSGSKAQIAVKLFGDDLQQLYSTGQKIKNVVAEVPGVVDLNIEQLTERPELEIRPRRDMLAKYGISPAAFNSYITTMLQGDVVSTAYRAGLPYDITLKAADKQRDTAGDISEMLIDSNVGSIPLSYVADVVTAQGPAGINRENVSRRIIVSANVDGRDLRSVAEEIQHSVAEQVQLPENYYVVYGGQFENEAAASRTLILASLLSLVVIFILLFHEFKSIRQALIILVNMPLAMIGGVFILKLTGSELNIPAIIGFISLLGITTRNGMLLLSRYNALRADDSPQSLRESIFRGSADRLSPIIMTALTSALALIPIALRPSEPGNEIQAPLATVILGGLISATLLNLVVVPVIYYLTEKRAASSSVKIEN